MNIIGIGKTQTKFQENLLINGKYTIKASFLICDNSILFLFIYAISRSYTRYVIIYLVLKQDFI